MEIVNSDKDGSNVVAHENCETSSRRDVFIKFVASFQLFRCLNFDALTRLECESSFEKLVCRHCDKNIMATNLFE